MLNCEETTFRNRRAVRLASESLEVIAYTGGGHIASLRMSDIDVNPLWEPPWPLIEPEAFDVSQHLNIYGPGEGRLLAALAGHSLCLNHFGDLSESEIAAEGYFHGEAPNLPWTVFSKTADTAEAQLHYGLELPDARMEFHRVLSLRPGESTVYFSERTANLARWDSPLLCQQHVTLGPPFVEGGVARLDLPAKRGHTFPFAIDDSDPYNPDTEYTWPEAPLRQGGTRDLRVYPTQKYMSVLSVLLEPESDHAFTAVSNPKIGLMLLYIFPREIFPWAALWYENQAADFPPYNGRTIAWGVEFGTVPTPINRMDILAAGPLFDQPRFETLSARETLEVDYQATLMKIPDNWQGVASVDYANGETVVSEVGSSRTVSCASDWRLSVRREQTV